MNSDLCKEFKVKISPKEEGKIIKILRVLAEHCTKENFKNTNIVVIDPNGKYRLICKSSFIDTDMEYLVYDKKTKVLSSCQKKILLAFICNALDFSISQDFYNLCAEYEGEDFLEKLFGLNNQKMLIDRKLLNMGDRIIESSDYK
jgi:hypothetical protein